MTDKVNRTLQGRVVSDKMNQTIVVLVERKVTHPLYPKIIKRATKIHAHDQNNECGIGDLVKIKEVRPISKTKAWMLESIIEKAK